MRDSDFVPLQCSPQALASLSSGLSRFGRAEGVPDWLVSAVWLCTNDRTYLATSFTNVLGDGYVARTLNLHSPEELSEAVEADLPDIEDRLRSRGQSISLPQPCGDFAPPGDLQQWAPGTYSTKVLIRVAERLLTTHRVACGLIFQSDAGRSLLVGTDTASIAMVLSEDDAMIERYRKGCEEIPAGEFSSFA